MRLVLRYKQGVISKPKGMNMAGKPVIFTIDDDPEVLQAIERDLRHKYSSRYRVLRADSAAKALAALRELQRRDEPVALFVVDQRMPQMSGVEFLKEALKLYPSARRVLLTAYADTDAAIQAINDVQINHYLNKPWDPPQEHLYPVLTDLLDDWQAAYSPPFEGVQVVGHRWSPQAHEIKDFLARNQIPYQSLDIETDPDAQRLIERTAAADPTRLPLIIFPDGKALAEPDIAAVAAQLGLATAAKLRFYDLVIVGGGPAGLAAAVYGASEGLSTLMIEREAPGGQAGTSSRIENYLGFPSGLSGADLARRAVAQAKRFGVEMLTPQEVTGLRVDGPYRYVELGDGTEVSCHALLIATGVSWRKLDVPGMDKLTGAGVYYGATSSEAPACTDEDVYIVGGANSAGQAAMFFSKYASKVFMLVRGDTLTKGMSQYLINQIEATANIEVLLNTEVKAVHGESCLAAIDVADCESGEQRTLPASALFIFIGAEPHTEWVGDVLACDGKGFILSGPDLMQDGQRPRGWQLKRDPYLLETNVPGVFVAGDVRHQSVKRVASAVGEGSIAVQFIHQYLASTVRA